MTVRPEPTVRQRRLGSELRRLREGAKISQRDAGAHIDGGQGKLSKIETGRQNIRRLELLALLELYRVEDEGVRDALLSLLREVRKKGWWHQHSGELSSNTLDVISLEEECDRILHYCNMTLPDLLQTDEYAAALIAGLEPHLSEEQVRLSVRIRMRRQRILDRTDPPQFLGVLDEALLRRPVGGVDVMARQLRKLIAVSHGPEVVVQVVPFDRAVYPGVHGSFRALLNSSPVALDVVEAAHWAGDHHMEDPVDVEKCRLLFDEIRSSALSSRQSMELISQILIDFENGRERAFP
ncbi:helix-turn-helix domain-containing protein [Streptomyces sp. NPDC056549]|uniref:helix-turn-helix domain-containing protein n=1 Tax=Streptomyces sp. NPDC056549 TaxID=3345864 RepID=UPI0036CFD1C9